MVGLLEQQGGLGWPQLDAPLPQHLSPHQTGAQDSPPTAGHSLPRDGWGPS